MCIYKRPTESLIISQNVDRMIMLFLNLILFLLEPGEAQRIGDMIYAEPPKTSNTEQAMPKEGSKLWKNGEVFYRFEKLDGDETLIENVLKDIENQVPCLSFQKIDDSFSGNQIIFSSAGDDDNSGVGCWSYVGSVGAQGGKNGQVLNLGQGCFTKRVVTHEVLHALGR